MTWNQMLYACFAVVFSCAYQVGVVAIGFATGNEFAWKMGLVGLGLTYVCFMIQAVKPDWTNVANTAVACSIVAGVLAGLALLIR